MTTTRTTEAPSPRSLRTVAVRADATSVHGLAATPEEARRWLDAVIAHGRQTALARIVIAASTPAPNPDAANPVTVISAVGDDPWEHVDDWTVAGERGDDPRCNNPPLPAGTRTAIIDGAGNLHELAANPETSRDSPSAFLDYLAALPTIDKQPLAVIHASPDRPWIGIQRRRAKVLQLPDDA